MSLKQADPEYDIGVFKDFHIALDELLFIRPFNGNQGSTFMTKTTTKKQYFGCNSYQAHIDRCLLHVLTKNFTLYTRAGILIIDSYSPL